ncbi:ATP-binding protein [Streptomyces sp. PmtG]
MSADGRPSGIAGTPRSASSLPLLLLGAAAVAGAGAAGLAPDAARSWVAAVAAVGWLALALLVWTGRATTSRLRAHAAQLEGQLDGARTQLGARGAEVIHLAQVTVPTVARALREGGGPQDALSQIRPPAEPSHRELLNVCLTALTDAERRAASAAAAAQHTGGDLARMTEDVRLLAAETLPGVVRTLRDGASVDRVLAQTAWPADPTLRDLTEAAVRELALSERRAAAAQAASAKALSRVQAKSVSMLADLRDMQDRHGEQVFGDLLRIDHSTSQLGLMTDRLALLMGGRSSRAWNKPIVMESILRGAVGRIAAYQRVRLHSSSKAAVVGFAAEGVMHLLAELMDNAANFSPPTDEVHVYVEESRTGLVVTIEDSGLRMSEAALRRAKESVSGQAADLALLQGTRLGLAVVGRLAVKYGVSVNFRPSARGGTGVVVLLPPQLLAQQAQQGPANRADRQCPHRGGARRGHRARTRTRTGIRAGTGCRRHPCSRPRPHRRRVRCRGRRRDRHPRRAAGAPPGPHDGRRAPHAARPGPAGGRTQRPRRRTHRRGRRAAAGGSASRTGHRGPLRGLPPRPAVRRRRHRRDTAAAARRVAARPLADRPARPLGPLLDPRPAHRKGGTGVRTPR